jgi:hypothetical protein
MIQCDICKDWFHGNCVGVKKYLSNDLDKFHCPRCESIHGPSIFKPQTNLHRYNCSEPEAENKPVQTGTAVFIKELKSRHFPSADGIVLRLRGHQLTLPYLTQHGFDVPIIAEEKEGLETLLPPENFTVNDVENYIGSDHEVDVTDVTQQRDIRMKLGEFVEYYASPAEQRKKTLNVTGLEFSHTGLSQMVDAPYIARKLDWVNYVWPNDLPDDTEFSKPQVQKYCLMEVEDSYTDFHIDIGGSSVWYHILRGQKIFYLIRPTQANLSLYQRWMNSSTQSETFFGDQVDTCYKCAVKEGETMLIPTGWIYAILTPVDSLVFGGKFLNSLNISMQLQIYEIEKKIHTLKKSRFPAFETINWYAARSIANDLKEMNNMGLKCPLALLIGVKALVTTLMQWNQDKDNSKIRREEIPADIQSHKLLKDLSKEVRHAERFLNSLNPPKQERESKMKRKKSIDEYVVNFSQAQCMEESVILKEPLKLTLKGISKNGARPPLKLTLPKPATCPYSSNAFDASISDSADTDNAVPSENKLIERSVDKHVQLQEEEKPHGSKEPTAGFLKRFKPAAKDSIRKLSDSLHDFRGECDDDDILLIDESPENPERSSESSSSLEILSLCVNGKCEPSSELDVADEMDVVPDTPQNGIEVLLKACDYADREEHDATLEDKDNGRTSPSTREAIAGMLSMSGTFMPDYISDTEE